MTARRTIGSGTEWKVARGAALAAALLALAACAEPTTGPVAPDGGSYTVLPESVISIAAPYQNLNAARLRPEDGCYWYRHEGPVETTMLPLRTANGNPICTRAQDGTL